MLRLLLVVLLLASALAGATASLPAEVRRVLVLGDSITQGGQYVVDLETYFLTRLPTRRIEIINVGLSSETVSGLSEAGHAGGQFPRPDLHERLGRVLAQVKPDLVFACYGMNDGIYLPLGEERFEAYRSGQRRLHEAVVQAGARIIHVTPPVYDETRGKAPGYAAVLDAYSTWLLAQREAAGWSVIDLHFPMGEALRRARQADPQFTYSKDSIHPDATGHWVMARAILAGLGATDVADLPDAAAMAAVHPQGKAMAALVRERQELMKLAWLSATGHRRPGVKAGLPLPEAQARARDLDARIDALLGR